MLWHKTTGNGPNLVILHGWGYSSDILQGLVEKNKANYRITVIDLPGHGRSEDVDGDIESWGDELIKLYLKTLLYLVGLWRTSFNIYSK